MKAVLVTELGGTEGMIYTDVDLPSINANEVLIRVEKTSVNFADIKARYGNKGTKLPFIPGLDAMGIIEQVGSAVRDLQAGQRVIAFPAGGSYAEYAVASEQLTFPLPDGIDQMTAAACPIVAFTAYKLLADVARLQAGETVLIHAAAGGVGTTAIQLAKLLGASQVIGTVGSKQKVDSALEAGADQVVVYTEGDFAQSVNDWTSGAGVDVILDSIAGAVTQKSLECLAYYGRLVQFGNSSGASGTVQTADLHSSCRSVLGFSLGTTRARRPELLRETASKVFSYLAAGQLQIKIGREFSLSEAAQAHQWVESRQSTGKVMLHVK
ncbi:quinone oxidoreductase family protein [Brevibacillus fulvus]|nr:zinc-binding dehydrogenase [Brevibacillus fulvus]